MLGDERSLVELATNAAAPDRSRGKAVGALSGLAGLRDRAAAIEAFRAAFDGGSPALQRDALSAWLRVAPEDEGAAKALRQAAASADPELRGRATSEAAGLGQRFVDVLLAGLDDPDPRIVEECVMTLARWNALTLSLLSKLHANPSAEVRLHVLTSLEKIKDPLSVSLVLASLSDPSAFVRRHAATSLRALGARDAAPALQAAIQSEQDATARKAMLSALQALR
jgi:HEAT repeat protein